MVNRDRGAEERIECMRETKPSPDRQSPHPNWQSRQKTPSMGSSIKPLATADQVVQATSPDQPSSSRSMRSDDEIWIECAAGGILSVFRFIF